MNVVLISTYELGHQPFGIASPAAWLQAAGARVMCLDLAVQSFAPELVEDAGLVALYLPMHTATRLAGPVIEQVRALNPRVHLCCYGLYAPVNEPFLRGLGIQTILGGEFESGLLSLYRRIAEVDEGRRTKDEGRRTNDEGRRTKDEGRRKKDEGRTTKDERRTAKDERRTTNNERRTTNNERRTTNDTMLSSIVHRPSSQSEPRISLAKQVFLAPDRNGLPALTAYAHLDLADGHQRTVGYTEASRGCKHLCRHCPIVPVYGGRFRVIQRDVVLEDVRRQVAAGAQHITFGDPDFFNGPGHAIPLVRALHAEFPDLSYDVIIKVEHLLKHADLLPVLRDTGCVLVTSAVEAVDDAILERFDKHHTRADFARAVGLLRATGLALNPTFVAFTPWTTRASYLDFLRAIWELDLVEHVAPIQYAIRLLIPAGSRLLELTDVRALIGPFAEAALAYPWAHPDPGMDQLYRDVMRAVRVRRSRHEAFQAVWRLAKAALATPTQERDDFVTSQQRPARKPIPRMSEPWYC